MCCIHSINNDLFNIYFYVFSGGSGPPPYYPEYPEKPTNNLNQNNGPRLSSPDLEFPELPSVPADTPLDGNTPHDDEDDDIDFDDLTKRFEALKKKK